MRAIQRLIHLAFSLECWRKPPKRPDGSAALGRLLPFGRSRRGGWPHDHWLHQPAGAGAPALGYNEVSKTPNEKLLLLNIARVANEETVHFKSKSSITATFDWTTTVGIGGQLAESSGIDFFNFKIGASASENPIFSIIPLNGEEFTKRVVTPFKDDVFESIVYQGACIDQVMRLMGSGIKVEGPDGRVGDACWRRPHLPADGLIEPDR